MESVTLTKKGIRRTFYGPTEIVRACFEGWQDIPPEPSAPHRVGEDGPEVPVADAPATVTPNPGPDDPADDPAPDADVSAEHHKRRRPNKPASTDSEEK
ncbi:MAG TPA: hypothetical protein VHB02_06020 [Acidimicrobiales bacterium]|nr:hypothetical protein [Acidimicrobiales bacterium]